MIEKSSELPAKPTRWSYSNGYFERRQYFNEVLQESCDARGLKLRWLDEELWTGIVTNQEGINVPIYGYDLGANPSSSAKISDDKASTSLMLENNGIKSVPHFLISPNLTNDKKTGLVDLTSQAIEIIGLPMVAKPNASSSGGKGVYLCRDEREVFDAIMKLTERNSVAAVSPYEYFDEYRAVVLGREVLGIIGKQVPSNGWMHNMSLGARHYLLEADPRSDSLSAKIGEFAMRANHALGLNFATVDVAVSKDIENEAEPDLKILEINDGVAVNYHHPEYREPSTGLHDFAVQTYGRALEFVVDQRR